MLYYNNSANNHYLDQNKTCPVMNGDVVLVCGIWSDREDAFACYINWNDFFVTCSDVERLIESWSLLVGAMRQLEGELYGSNVYHKNSCIYDDEAHQAPLLTPERYAHVYETQREMFDTYMIMSQECLDIPVAWDKLTEL